MSHYSKGVDRDGVLQLDLVVRGTVPEFPENQVIIAKPYWEEYLQTGEGNESLCVIVGFLIII